MTEPFNSEQLRAGWADPPGRLLKVDECGCRHYELGNGLCETHWTEAISRIFEEGSDEAGDRQLDV